MLRVGAATEDEMAEREESLGRLLARASHLLSVGFSQQIKGHGVSATAWRILGALAERDGLTMTELADLVLFKQPTLTKAIDRMERDQLVQRRTPMEDRRRTLVFLTERGRRAAAPLVLRARQHDAAVARAIGDTAYHELKSALSALIGRLNEQDLPARERSGTLRR
ncbi:MAG TPA: MarR family transcriptional regulator [Stellaceae bacterium]|nr:MarR family transcriptional regulator [Stellaceae bacterium]